MKKANTKAVTTIDTATFNNLVNLLSVYSEAYARNSTLEAEIAEMTLSLIDDTKKEYAEIQTVLTQAESALETLCRANPTWFQEKRSVKTPYGSVGFKRISKLLVPNEELSIELVKAAERAADAPLGLIRTKDALDLEALEKLDDGALKAFRITRANTDEFSVKPVKLDLGRAVKEAAAQDATAAA